MTERRALQRRRSYLCLKDGDGQLAGSVLALALGHLGPPRRPAAPPLAAAPAVATWRVIQPQPLILQIAALGDVVLAPLGGAQAAAAPSRIGVDFRLLLRRGGGRCQRRSRSKLLLTGAVQLRGPLMPQPLLLLPLLLLLLLALASTVGDAVLAGAAPGAADPSAAAVCAVAAPRRPCPYLGRCRQGCHEAQLH